MLVFSQIAWDKLVSRRLRTRPHFEEVIFLMMLHVNDLLVKCLECYIAAHHRRIEHKSNPSSRETINFTDLSIGRILVVEGVISSTPENVLEEGVNR
jgi:hypothetical protein